MDKKAALNILELAQVDNLKQLKQAYRKQSQRFHPDKGGNCNTMVAINQAYEFLINEIKDNNYSASDGNQNLFIDLCNLTLANYLFMYFKCFYNPQR